MNIKAFTLVALSTLTLGLTAPAQANSEMCLYEDGFEVCITNLSLTTSGHDSFTVRGPGVNEKMNVQCRGGRVTDWNSYGNLSQSEAGDAAREFCSGRGTTGRGY